MHTEAEAKKKWCPEARLAVASTKSTIAVVNSTTNVLAEKIDHVACIASGCMHWRWVRDELDVSTGRGYCGLSGRP